MAASKVDRDGAGTAGSGTAAVRQRGGLIAGVSSLNGCHMLRHTAASAWLSAGVALAKVAALPGDTQEVVLSTYSHFLPGDEDRARLVMEQFWAAAETVLSAPDAPGPCADAG